MVEKQIENLASLVKNTDLQQYTGDAFWNIIKAVIGKDPFAGIEATKDVKQLLFHIPTAIFWNKMRRFLLGTYRNYEEQLKMASHFNNDEKKYTEFVKKQIYLIDKIDDDMKIDYLALLTRCMLHNKMDVALYFKLAKFINQCTSYELDYMKKANIDAKMENNAMVSSLYQYGLLDQDSDDSRVYYVFSGFGKALKGNCLNYDKDKLYKVFSTYESIEPSKLLELAVGDLDMGEF